MSKDLDGRAEGAGVPDSEGDLENRLSKLDAALKKARPKAGADEGSLANASSTAQGMAQALRLASEFAAGVIVGAGLGWFFDKALGTSPWGLIVLLMLGFAAGVLNILRSAALDRERGSTGG
ncbi:AtpZ/AtpI family protein [Terrihabitans sp. B22-R8]|uniref:AtpZ/AtpI family protein n=1 Tax=Terrihabitans sp. B22-R8 TaxID=3425128 RepID=UPI00403C5DC9